MAGIFICYRRADAEGWAGRLSDSLKAELGRVNIFRDIEDIAPGVEFDTYINDAVGSCDVLIALIGPRWLTVTDRNGLRRLDDPKDFTRVEILTALKENKRGHSDFSKSKVPTTKLVSISSGSAMKASQCPTISRSRRPRPKDRRRPRSRPRTVPGDRGGLGW